MVIMGKAIDMTGQITQYGVYIIERDFSNTHEAHWRCKCPICKREDWIVKGSRLRGENQIKMCKICSAKNNLKSIQQPYFKDIAGQRLGNCLLLSGQKKSIKLVISGNVFVIVEISVINQVNIYEMEILKAVVVL